MILIHEPVKKDIKPIETIYHGCRFRSRLEARWAVFFDHIKADWEYEPEGYDLGDGTYYLPDFLLYNVAVMDHESNIYCEVKGNMSQTDSNKIWKFSKSHKILVLGQIPSEKNMFAIAANESDQHDKAVSNHLCPPFGFDTLDGNAYLAIPCQTNNGLFGIVGPDWMYDIGEYSCNDKQTIDAYSEARQKVFEYIR